MGVFLIASFSLFLKKKVYLTFLQQTTNNKQQTTNNKQQTTNNKQQQQTTNNKQNNKSN